MSENYSMKLPEKFYCGFQQRQGQDDLPLGFMTPWGTDKAFEKRKDTVDRWAGQGRWRWNPTTRTQEEVGVLDPVTFDNIPVMGFKLGRAIRRCGWNGSGNTVIRVEDPRGFEVEIQVGNLLRIMENNTVENGEIMAECVWGRDGNANILLATNSEPYVQAVENTARSQRKTSVKDVKPGMKVRLQNGTEAIWVGMMYGIKHGDRYDVATPHVKRDYHGRDTNEMYEETGYRIRQDDKKKAFFIVSKECHANSGMKDCLEVASAAKIADIIDDTTVWTEEEAEQRANALLNRPSREFWYYYNGASDYIAVSFKKADLAFSLVDVTSREVSERVNPNNYNNSNRYLYDFASDGTFAIDHDGFVNRHGRSQVPGNRRFMEIYGDRVINGETLIKHSFRRGGSGIWGRYDEFNRIDKERPLGQNFKVLEFTYTGAAQHTIRVW